jgi:hypothetical protein
MFFYEEEIRKEFPELTNEDILNLKINVLVFNKPIIKKRRLGKAFSFNNKLYKKEKNENMEEIKKSGVEIKNKIYGQKKKINNKKRKEVIIRRKYRRSSRFKLRKELKEFLTNKN